MSFVGIYVGALTVKEAALRDDARTGRVEAHRGRALEVLDELLASPDFAGAGYFGVSGRLGHISEVAAIQRAIREVPGSFDAVASLGGESFLTYILADGRIINVLSHNKCAAGGHHRPACENLLSKFHPGDSRGGHPGGNRTGPARRGRCRQRWSTRTRMAAPRSHDRSLEDFQAGLAGFVDHLAALPRTGDPAACPKVVVTGDFFTRFNPFFTEGVPGLYAAYGIILKPVDLSDLVLYGSYFGVAEAAGEWGMKPGGLALAKACTRVLQPDGQDYLHQWLAFQNGRRSEAHYRRMFHRTGLLVANRLSAIRSPIFTIRSRAAVGEFRRNRDAVPSSIKIR